MPMSPTAAARSDTGAHPVDLALPDRLAEALTAFLTERRAAAAAIDPAFGAAADELCAFVLNGGKRIRPTVAWWGWRGAGGDPDGPEVPAVLRAIGALELIQACALVHDDLMDASATRRGRPTVHVEFARRHAAAAWRGRPARFGAAAAILLGDLALVWADDMLRGARLPADAAARAVTPWEAMRTEVLGGQYLDVFVQSTGDTSTRAALQVDRYKTAAYTVERPLHLGTLLADPLDGQRLLPGLSCFGVPLGDAFQMRDDVIGAFGDTSVTGKPVGDDLREGKPTSLLARAVALAEPAELDVLARVGSPHLGDDEVAEIQQVIVDTGALDELEARITTLAGEAISALERMAIDPAAREELRALAAFVVARVD